MTLEMEDIWGDRWQVEERRETAHGFDVLLGRPKGQRHGKTIIVTAGLAAHFERHRQAPSTLTLPIGGTAIKRIRRLLGHHRYIDNAAWWDERIDDLIRLTAAEFAAAHDVKEHTAAVARLRILGPTQRPAFWWRAPEVSDLLRSTATMAEIATILDVAAVTVRRLRAWTPAQP
ncbi:hypothetical protein [Azospirillum brasilense]|uniref:hypothetical protein n=1 Tax=Azospirillum brasilense TaxID=192 RepID=UPI000FF5588E|nr:hypothetical protein [Azospirillum brasilense]NUB25749.1 hypothetical protein [Azospirillum brasilense]NUB33887.1 hypothetical protein [Azospirillum brasilense]RIW07740.1 hypothetical protein D2T81_02565 [Azospirillum brasilense]